MFLKQSLSGRICSSLFFLPALFLVTSVFAPKSSFSQTGTKWNAPDAFRQLNPLSSFPFVGYPDSTVCAKPFGGFQLYKDALKGWLLIGSGNGQVWKLDQEDRWVRQDSTECVGYNAGAMVLPGPMKYGGYGIWRSFGLLLFYSWQAHEWHTIEISAEHPANSGTPLFYDSKDSLLYQAGSNRRHDGLKNVVEITDSLYRLDLRTGEWLTLGRLNQEIPKEYRIATGDGTIFSVPDGVIYIATSQRKPLYINFRTQRCFVLSDRVSDRLWTLSGSQYVTDKRPITTDKGFYSVDHSYQIVDSMSWDKLLNDYISEYPLIERQEAMSRSFSLQIVFTLLFFGASFLTYRRIRRNRSSLKDKTTDRDQTPSVSPPFAPENSSGASVQFLLKKQGDSYVFNGKALTGLSAQEVQVLNVLVEKRGSGVLSLSTQQFNEILGVEQRTLDSQKKIRSEVIRNINRQFNVGGFPGEAVQRSRDEDDRRAVTYELATEIELVA